MSDTPFDVGLQPERTLLAWRRTCLALAVVSATGARFAAPSLGAWVELLGLAGVLVAAGAYLAVAHRYRLAHTSLAQAQMLTLGGRSLAWMAAATAALAVAATAFVVVHV